jgi:hypothetical protein
MYRFLWLGTICLMLAIACLAAPAQASLYTFDNLTVDQNLIPQDNWTHADLSTSGTQADVMKVRTGTGTNTSKVASPFTGNVQVMRQNNANFSIPTFTGTEKIYYQMDLKYGTQQQTFLLQQVQISPLAYTSQSPWAGFSRNFMISPPNPGFDTINFAYRNFGTGAEAQTFIPVPDVAPEIQLGDWVTVRQELDLAANGGMGTASMFYKDLTLGQTTFTPVPGLQNKNANLLNQAAANKYFWDYMFMRGGLSGENNPMDNFEVGILRAAVPEPGSMLLITMGLIGLAGCGRRNRRTS